MTEDNVRYYWFAAMLQEDADLAHYTMEYPYDKSLFQRSSRAAKKELDFLYLNGDDSYCMEIKFHRNPDPKSTYAHTDAAGSLFNDMLRVSIFKPGKSFSEQKYECKIPANAKRLFLYVTDNEMHEYLGNAKTWAYNAEYRKVLHRFYADTASKTFYVPTFNNVPDTFLNCALDGLDTDLYSLASMPRICLLYDDTWENMQSESFKKQQCHVRLYEVEQNYR